VVNELDERRSIYSKLIAQYKDKIQASRMQRQEYEDAKRAGINQSRNSISGRSKTVMDLLHSRKQSQVS